ncbi:MAG: amidohydrolase [Firmicutes bacterium]|nr:amidohydrolase [Bacillota bacterium]MBR0113980.1 amidohydrolase [Bacillota bacterium]
MLLIKNGYVKTMAGHDIEKGCVLINDEGKIEKVAAKIAAPKGAKVIDAGGKLVTPGCVDAHCHIGMLDSAMRWEGDDVNEIVDPVTPQLRAIDGIYVYDEAFPQALTGGVTSAVTGPGSANVLGGTFVAIKTYGNSIDKMIIKDPVAMKCAFGENPKGCYGQKGKSPMTRMAVASMLRETLFKTKRYMQDKADGKDPAFDMKLEAMIPVLEGKIPLKAHAHRADDILTSIRVAKEFGVKITLDHCTEGHLIVDELVEEGWPCFVGPTFGGKSKIELSNKTFDTPRILNENGLCVSIITDAPVIPLEYLPMCAGLAVNAGLKEEEAWKAITINPANSTGIGDRVGSLEPGKDGDVVIWTGNPMRELGAMAETTIIEGKVVYQR